jgi:hypothetical protein
VTIRSSFSVLLLMITGLLLAAMSRSPWTEDCGRLAFDWSVEHGDHTYRLRGQYSIASLSGRFATAVSSDDDREGAELCVPPGLYSVALEPGYTLERVEAHTAGEVRAASEGEAGQLVPALLVSNPVVVTAQAGHVAAMSLSLVDMAGTSSEPEPTCMSGS